MAAKKSVQLSGVVVAESAICSIDPDQGVLMYRGYDTADAIDRSAGRSAPMDMLRTAVSALAFDDPGRGKIDSASGRRTATRLIAQVPTIVARYERRRQGLEPVAPDPSLSYAENFLAMLHGERPNEREACAFDVAMILHAEHELNASTFAARVVAGTGTDLTGAVAAAIAARSSSKGSPRTSRTTGVSRTGTRSPTWRSRRCSRRRGSTRTSIS